jgi:hypothetical protein
MEQQVRKFDYLTGSHCDSNMKHHHLLLSTTNDPKTGFNHRYKDQADCGVWTWSPEMENAHIEFCRKQQINPMSVCAITDMIEITLKSLYEAKYEPEWLQCAHSEPIWRHKKSWLEFNTPAVFTEKMISFVYRDKGTASFFNRLKEMSLCNQIS